MRTCRLFETRGPIHRGAANLAEGSADWSHPVRGIRRWNGGRLFERVNLASTGFAGTHRTYGFTLGSTAAGDSSKGNPGL